jgi:solute carrier family 35
LAVTTVIVALSMQLKIVAIPTLCPRKAVAFFPVAMAFTAGIVANARVLQSANIETFIVFRASTPLVVAIADWACLGRQLPNLRSLASCLAVVLGAVVYVITDEALVVKAYFWVGVWMAIFTIDQVYIKHICDRVQMTTWERVLYTNALSLIPCAALVVAQELPVVTDAEHWTPAAIAALGAAAMCGVGMSYASFLVRAQLSATAFTMIGVVCKIASVFVNILIWDKHASPIGIAALLLCLLAGSMYQQSPLRSAGKAPKEDKLEPCACDREKCEGQP